MNIIVHSINIYETIRNGDGVNENPYITFGKTKSGVVTCVLAIGNDLESYHCQWSAKRQCTDEIVCSCTDLDHSTSHFRRLKTSVDRNLSL